MSCRFRIAKRKLQIDQLVRESSPKIKPRDCMTSAFVSRRWPRLHFEAALVSHSVKIQKCSSVGGCIRWLDAVGQGMVRKVDPMDQYVFLIKYIYSTRLYHILRLNPLPFLYYPEAKRIFKILIVTITRSKYVSTLLSNDWQDLLGF